MHTAAEPGPTNITLSQRNQTRTSTQVCECVRVDTCACVCGVCVHARVCICIRKQDSESTVRTRMMLSIAGGSGDTRRGRAAGPVDLSTTTQLCSVHVCALLWVYSVSTESRSERL